jgi:hypothetical protein
MKRGLVTLVTCLFVILLAFSSFNSASSSCSRTNTGGFFNFSCGVDSLTSSMGTNSWTVWTRDSAGNVGKNSITFSLVSSTSSSGWGNFTPSIDTQITYVSSTSGDDATCMPVSALIVGGDPFNPSLGTYIPCKSASVALSKLRNGYPDWVLFKKGEVWNEQIIISKSGKSKDEKILVGAYGGESYAYRPLIRSPSDTGPAIKVCCNLLPSNITFADLKVIGYNESGIKIQGYGAKNYLFEDMDISDTPGSGIIINSTAGDGINLSKNFTNIVLRRSIIINNSALYESQGIYATGVDGLVIEENLFDHNGWSVSADRDLYKNNILIDNEGNFNTTIRNNMVFRASSHGLQLRPGGVIDNNLFVQNPVGILFGGGDGYSLPNSNPNGVNGSLTNNVIIEGVDISSTVRKGYGIDVLNANNVSIENNVLAHDLGGDSISSHGISLSFDIRGALIKGNLFYNWNNSIKGYISGINTSFVNNIIQDYGSSSPLFSLGAGSTNYIFTNNTYYSTRSIGNRYMLNGIYLANFASFISQTEETGKEQQVSFLNPNRNVNSYSASIGGLGTIDDFISKAKQQSRSSWDTRYTAIAVNNYIREGFGMSQLIYSSCSDGIRNGDETGVDCGGSCGICLIKRGIVNHTNIDEVALYSQSLMDAIGQKKWFFTHASVGANMISGLNELHSENPNKYKFVSSAFMSYLTTPPAITTNGTIYECHRGNPGWAEKYTYLNNSVYSGWNYDKVDAVMDKLCYIDQNADVNRYLSLMSELEKAYPNTVFVYTTMPLTYDSDSSNVLRNNYNNAVRAYCSANNKMLFDVADIESHDLNGIPQTFVYGGSTYYKLYTGYTSDGGHLNSLGAKRVASGWYAVGKIMILG